MGHGKDAAAVRRRHRGVASEGDVRGGLHARFFGLRFLRIRGLVQREGESPPGLGAAHSSGFGGGFGRAASCVAFGASVGAEIPFIGAAELLIRLDRLRADDAPLPRFQDMRNGRRVRRVSRKNLIGPEQCRRGQDQGAGARGQGIARRQRDPEEGVGIFCLGGA